MNTALQLLVMAVLSGEPATATTLDGESIRGEVLTLNDEQLVIQSDDGRSEIAIDQLMLVQFERPAEAVETTDRSVVLVDGSSIQFETVTSEPQAMTVSSKVLGEHELSTEQVSRVRWSPVDDQIAESWADLQTRGSRDDLLVFRKGDVLDYVGGTVTRITDKGVTVSVKGRELTAPLERVFAVIYSGRETKSGSSAGALKTTSGDVLQLKSLTLSEDVMEVKTDWLDSLTIPSASVNEIDYAGGRIRFLADLPFDESASQSPDTEFPVVWFTAKNFPAGSGGRRPLLIGEERFSRGLWMHSGAVVRFRLNRQFSELRTTAGFDLNHAGNMPRFDPKVKLVIEGDGSQLYEHAFNWDDPPEKVRVDLQGVRELVIRVESNGSAQGILEHFALGDAQVIK
ncbi:NPCBM/NEW2 domain-containing protein [Thalassoglobus sp. JC818]|uniref:NPCBM/NEW2 domain-containing protein n=1 Tax=Thalassoglobus sp. JC818 TaxID=3232136 RepID=UPI003459D66E